MRKSTANTIKNIVGSILIVLIFFLFFISLVNITFKSLYVETQVTGYSMQPTINMNAKNSSAKGDKIYINEYASFTNNDIVVAKVDWHKDYIIKRVVGTPGDKIQIKDLQDCYGVFVNNKLLYTKDKYYDEDAIGLSGSYEYYDNYIKFLNNLEYAQYVVNDDGEKYIQLGKDDYFLMGDNWGHTTDSLTKGPVKTKDIIGKVDFIIDVTNENPFTETLLFLKKLFYI